MEQPKDRKPLPAGRRRSKVRTFRAGPDDLARLQQLSDARAEDGSKVVRAGLVELAEGAREVEQLQQIAASTEDEATQRELQRLIDEKAERVGYRPAPRPQ